MGAGAPSPDAAAVILAGGLSRRLGRHKAFEEVGGRELLERALERATAGFREVAVAAMDPALVAAALGRYGWRLERGAAKTEPAATEFRKEDRRLRLVRDLRPGRGPLAGLEAGLQAVEAPLCWVLACDLPFVTAEVGKRLVRELAASPASGSGPRVLVPRLGDWLQPLCAAYERAALGPVARCLEAGDRSLHHLLGRLAVHTVPAERFADLGDPERLFLNVNLPADLDRARRLAAGDG